MVSPLLFVVCCLLCCVVVVSCYTLCWCCCVPVVDWRSVCDVGVCCGQVGGEGRAGKSTTQDSLLGQPFNPEMETTNGITIKQAIMFDQVTDPTPPPCCACCCCLCVSCLSLCHTTPHPHTNLVAHILVCMYIVCLVCNRKWWRRRKE